MKIKLFLLFVMIIGGLLLCCPIESFGQATPPPPSLPGMPDQAPLGGLGLLAAAGGAYAWRKLRNQK